MCIDKKKKQLYVFVHIDADPDRTLVRKSMLIEHSKPSAQGPEWNCLITTFEFLRRFTEKLKDFGLTFRSTFFLRADEQVKKLYGTYTEVFLRFYDGISQFFNIGWHPHLYRWSNRDQCWHQECHDNKWMREVLTNCYNDLRSQGFIVQFSKMGWCYHNNITMKTLSELGLSADFSALPGARSPGYLKDGSFLGKYDWSETPTHAYKPSEHDYQKPGSLSIIEIPLTTYRLEAPLVFLYTSKLALKGYLELRSFHPPSFKMTIPLLLPNLLNTHSRRKIYELMRELNKFRYITMYFHPEDFLDPTRQRIIESFILDLVSAANKQEIEMSFTDASDLYKMASTGNMHQKHALVSG